MQSKMDLCPRFRKTSVAELFSHGVNVGKHPNTVAWHMVGLLGILQFGHLELRGILSFSDALGSEMRIIPIKLSNCIDFR